MEKGLQDDLTEGLFGVSSKTLSDMTSGRAVGNTEGQKTGETTTQPTARILANTEIRDDFYSEHKSNPFLKEPSTQDFVPKDTEKKPSSISLARGLQNDPFGLKETFGALTVDRPKTGIFVQKQNIKKKTTPKIQETASIARKNCAKLEERGKQIENLAKKTSKMSDDAEKFKEAMEALKKQQKKQECVISGGKKSRRKKKKNKNRKKSTRKKRRK